MAMPRYRCALCGVEMPGPEMSSYHTCAAYTPQEPAMNENDDKVTRAMKALHDAWPPTFNNVELVDHLQSLVQAVREDERARLHRDLAQTLPLQGMFTREQPSPHPQQEDALDRLERLAALETRVELSPKKGSAAWLLREWINAEIAKLTGGNDE